MERVAHSTSADVGRATDLAALAAAEVSASTPATRAGWIWDAGESLLHHRDELVVLADRETALGRERLNGELAKAVDSSRFYAAVAVEGSYLGASRETTSDGIRLARWNRAIGPVAVFGASNFPFGFGSFGHDVASAIAAGCPVIVKAHPAHPRLAERIAEIVSASLLESGAPVGIFTSVVGFDAGLTLVDSPRVKAVAFTGSQSGGMALVERAAARGIPVFAEMGTVNPVVVTPDAAPHARRIAAGFVQSFTLGAGQFCTKPGLILVPRGHAFVDAIREELGGIGAQTMLSGRVAESFAAGTKRLGAAGAASASGADDGGFVVGPQLFEVDLPELRPGSALLEECFGPVSLVCEYDDFEEALTVVSGLQPSLAASVFTGVEGGQEAVRAVEVLLGQVGRVAVNAWPTGVVTAWSQHHGGPWPATSRPEASSVGAAALSRFVRPVTVQNGDFQMLSPAVHASNPWGIPQRVDGCLIVDTRS